MKTLITLAAAGVMAFAGNASAGPTEDLIAKEKCAKCHTATTTKKGPSWASVAEKYKGKPDAAAKLFSAQTAISTICGIVLPMIFIVKETYL